MTKTLSNETKLKIAELLKPILADQFVLYTKARNYHWNVTGNMFFTLHIKFEELYTELANDIDETAERIRTYGLNAPGTMSEFLKLSGLKEEAEATYPDQFTMAKKISDDYDFIAARLNEVGLKLQKEYGDEITAGKLYSIAERYEKHAWLLKSLQ
ncbi:Dps family protein [Stygiobacter electus]|jgi:starvation-inducible DNA-binding protein|uniref:DNA starvation/stationary phase protection protein n=1 Tax=Stygiobacter electus TaxID=3032292 RepID=A0AAE3NY21_9BACT|nr:DNA starvation/stationary phase protection protein [Stygiobacter electus]MDF1612186.1 DNA starvation/stationary phase protection protein [Stygiobacter electus]